MSQASFPANLRQVAILNRSVSSEERSRWQDVAGQEYGHHLYELARQVHGVAVLDRALVLPTFFTAEAVARLLTLPNTFWFWNVVYYAAEHPARNGQIDHVIIDRVFRQKRDCLAGVYDLEKAIDQLSAHELALRVAEGVILFKSLNWQHLNDAALVFNPIFQPQG